MTFVNDNNEALEVDAKLGVTKQGVSFFDGSINGDVSLNFAVKNTAENRKVLNYNGPQMLNQIAWVKQPFNLMRDGNVFMRGSIVIQADDGVTLNCYFVSGNSNWIQLLNGLISELNWENYVTQMNPLITGLMFPSYPSTFAPVKTSGIIFPWVDWAYNFMNGYNIKYMFGYDGLPRKDNTVDSSGNLDNSMVDFYPCLYMSSLVSEIFQQNGLKIAGNIVNDPLFKTMIVPPVSGLMKRIPFKDVICTGSSQVIGAPPTKYNSFTTIRDVDGQFSASNGTFTPKKSQIYNFALSLSALSVPVVSVDVYVNGLFNGNTNLTTAQGWTFNFDIIKGQSVEFRINTACTLSMNLTITTPIIIKNGDYVDPSNFLPKMTCLSVVKFLVNFFGCQTYFDEFSKTVTMNIVEKLKPELAPDWSEYFVSCRSEYTVNQAGENFLRMEDPSDQEPRLKNYNALHEKQYGEGVVTTTNTLKAKLDIVKIPFGASEFDIDLSGTWCAKVPLINLVDGEAVPYTAITDLGVAGSLTNFIRYTVAIQLNLHEVIRIVDANGNNLGYFQTQAVGATTLDVPSPFFSNHIGTIYRQTINYQTIKPRILVVKPEIFFSDFASSLGGAKPWNKTNFLIITSSASGKGIGKLYEKIDYAFYCKNKTGEPIDTFVANCSIDNPDISDFTDPSVSQLSLNKVSQFIKNPNFRFKMLLPESVFQSFDFSYFIYVKSEPVTGYFFIQSIVNYQDASNPVEVNLYMI